MDQTLDGSALAMLGALLDEGVLLGTRGVCVYASARAEQLLGKPHGALAGTPLTVSLPGYGSRLPGPGGPVGPGGGRVWTWQAADGRLLECRLRPLGEDEGDVIAVLDDVTEARGDARGNRTERERLERAQAAAKVGTWELDLETATIWATPEAFRVYGLEPTADGEIPLAEIRRIPIPEDRPRLDAALGALVAGGASYDLAFQVRRPNDGQVLTVRSRAELVLDPDGRPVRVLGTVQDVSERMEAERRATRAERLAAIGQFAGGIAHDFNNLLTAIGGYMDLIRDEVPSSEQVDGDFAEVQLGLVRARDLVGQLLTFAGHQRRETATIELAEIVRRISPMLRRLIGEQVEVVIEDDAPGILVVADPGQVEQVILNLAINARDAMPGGGRLLIRTDTGVPSAGPDEETASWARLSVADTGHGINADDLGHIFEPFYTTKGLGQGTGMGLAVVHGIMRQSGGLVEVESEPGAGTTFHAYFPVVDRTPAAVPTATPPPPAAPGAGEHILLAEDNEAVLGFAVRTLRKAGYRVTVAADGAVALRELQAAGHRVDLIVTDLAMPNVGGRALAAAARERSPGTRILFVSGYDPREDLVEGDPDAAFLAKPYSADALLQAVRRVLEA